MNNPLPTAIGALAVLGFSFASTLGEYADGVIRVVTLFTVLGTLIAYRRYQRHPGFDPFPIITRWSAVGLLAGVVIELLRAVS